MTSSLKVAGTQEANDTISNEFESKKFPAGHYELLDKGYPLRIYDLDGKDFTPEPDGKFFLYMNIITSRKTRLKAAPIR